MPPAITPPSISARAWRAVNVEQSCPSAPRTPGTSVMSTSFSARIAAARCAANGSALTLSVSPCSSAAMGAITGMKSSSWSLSISRASTAVTSPTRPSSVRVVRRARARLPSLPVMPTARPPE